MSNGTLSAVLAAFTVSAAFATPAEELRVSGPFTHENLSIYLLHRGGQPTPTNYLTLGEAMSQKKAKVYETGNVQELSIENQSAQPMFVQAGDIVKGGKQDRVLTTDMVVPPHSGKLSIASFCVEQGRWTKRGAEPAEEFNASVAAVPTRALKQAMREPGNQTKVWSEVAAARTGLGAASGGVGLASVGPPPAHVGATSMQMALEARPVKDAVGQYTAALSKVVDGRGDAVGYVYTVNGKFSGADMYGSADLFRRMWPKLLESSAAEALSERSKGGGAKAPDVATIRKALADGDSGRAGSPRKVGALAVTKKESEKAVLYVTADERGWMHKSYVAK